jgi:transposase InsO family protein
MKALKLGFRLVAADRPLMDKYDRWRKTAELLKLSKKAKQKLEWFIYYYNKAHKKALVTCRYFGISKTSFYKWLSVFDETNFRALEEGSRAPVTRRISTLEVNTEQRILALRKLHPEYGKMKLQALYQFHYKEYISSWQCQLVIEKYHLQRTADKTTRSFRKQSLSKRRIQKLKKESKPGFLVAFDSIVLYWNGKTVYIVTAIDTVSKIAWARAYTTHSSATTKDLFQRLYVLVFGNISNALQDNGSEFEKYFEKLLTSMDIPQYFSRVKTPKDNPVCERFNRTVKSEFLRMGNMTSDLEELNRRLSKWLVKYNFYRPHQTLNYQTPIAYYTQYLQKQYLSAM